MRATLYSLLVLTLAALAQAQPVTVSAPPDRFVAPGEFVTLVFRLEAVERTEVRLEAAVSAGWAVVRQPGEMTLEPGRSTPVAVTVEVPRDAPAFAVERVTLRAESRALTAPLERRVELIVTELVDVDLDAPREALLGPEGFDVVAVNRGNRVEEVVVEFRRGATVLASRELTLQPGARETLRFEPERDGLHAVVLRLAEGGEVRRTVSVDRLGLPSALPFVLAASAYGSLSTDGVGRGGVSLRGPLSDFVMLDANVDLVQLLRSHAQVETDDWTLRLGAQSRALLGVRSLVELGVGVVHLRQPWAFGVVAGQTNELPAGIVQGRWASGPSAVVIGAGLHDGAPHATLEALHRGAAVDVRAGGSYRPGELDAGLHLQDRDGDRTTELDLDVRSLLTPTARLRVALRHGEAGATVYADATVPIGEDALRSARLGFVDGLVTPLPGELILAAQGGTRESFATLTYRALLRHAWRVSGSTGVRYDTMGFGVSLGVGLSVPSNGVLSADANIVYYPDSDRLGGRVSVRAVSDPEVARRLAATATWDLSEQALRASGQIGWRTDPWEVVVDAALGYVHDQDSSGRWSGGLTLRASYAFDVVVPEAVSEGSGGRRTGRLHGSLVADDGPVPGVLVQVGRFRLETDAAGRFEVDLPPGSYQVRIEVASLPLQYQLLGDAQAVVEVGLRSTVEVAFRVVRTAVLRGRVLETSSGDERADDAMAGVAARLLVTDADGLRRVVATDDEGRFEVRGLVPGEVEVLLSELPMGASVVGANRQRVTVSVEAPGDITFLVEPLAATIRSFAAPAARVRAVELERERVPPGAAPLVRVVVEGRVDGVEVRAAEGTSRLEQVDDAWLGRVPVPIDAAEGPYGFVTVARSGVEESTRRGKLIVDPNAPVIELSSDAPVRPGTRLTVEAAVAAVAESVRVTSPFGEPVTLRETAPGRWIGYVAVPADTEDGVYTVMAEAITEAGVVWRSELRFRVLVR